jgi:hypothetical protein
MVKIFVVLKSPFWDHSTPSFPTFGEVNLGNRDLYIEGVFLFYFN